jgi:hypothetical protein
MRRSLITAPLANHHDERLEKITHRVYASETAFGGLYIAWQYGQYRTVHEIFML